jgi:peptidoglycan/LPS O-acetylase OafA/YrhL
MTPLNNTSLAYRPEIDGLRAIAVLSVIFFHAGFGGFPGGFVGVDVFFVISGFLITGIVMDEQDRGVFSFARFYARRARRILPALFLTLLVCAVAALWVLSPLKQVEFFKALIATVLFYSNVYHGKNTSYFDAPAEEQPLLHTWSLSVEEQYYFFLPALLLLCWRWNAKRVGPVLLGLALVSIAISEYGWRHAQNQNFFFSPSRIWELLIGSLAALVAREKWSFDRESDSAAWVAGAGLTAIVASIGLLSRNTPSPSVWILVPTLGTALVLVLGNERNLTGRILGCGWLVYIGLISYSAYLWHQPVLVFVRIYTREPLSMQNSVLLIFGILALSYLTWKYVEQPVRRIKTLSHQHTLLIALVSTLGLALVGVSGKSYSASVESKIPASVAASFGIPARTKECLDIPYAHSNQDGWYCKVNPDGAQIPSFFVFGDSHGLQLVSAFDAAAKASNRTGQFAGFSGCAPFLGIYPLTRPDQATNNCHTLNARVLAHVRGQGFKDVFLVAKWSYYTDFWKGTSYLNAIGLSKSDQISVEQSRKAFEAGLRNTIHAYHAIGVRLHIIEQVPQQLHSPETIYAEAWARPGNVQGRLSELSVPLAGHQSLQSFSWAQFRMYGAASGVVRLNFDRLFCDQKVCRVGTPSVSFYQDPSHLSKDGAALTIPALTELLTARK